MLSSVNPLFAENSESRNPSQRVFGAILYAFHAKDAFVFIALDADQREITYGLKENGDRTDIFAECPVVFAYGLSPHETGIC